MLDDYIEHIRNSKNKSMIARVYGVFSIKTNYFDDLDIMIMQNTVLLQDKNAKEYTFDIKGSLINRKTEFIKGYPGENKKVLKDVNFLELSKSAPLLNLNPQESKDILAQLKSDSEFLRDQGIMDYSLLLVTEHCMPTFDMSHGETSILLDNTMRFNSRTRNKYTSVDKHFIYHIGVIDFLQQWDINKKLEAKLKEVFKRQDKTQISAIPPIPYSKRFIDFMSEKIFVF